MNKLKGMIIMLIISLSLFGICGCESKESLPSYEQITADQAKNIMETEKDLTIADIINFIKEKWSIEYTYTGLKNLLKNQFNINVDEYIKLLKLNCKDRFFRSFFVFYAKNAA